MTILNSDGGKMNPREGHDFSLKDFGDRLELAGYNLYGTVGGIEKLVKEGYSINFDSIRPVGNMILLETVGEKGENSEKIIEKLNKRVEKLQEKVDKAEEAVEKAIKATKEEYEEKIKNLKKNTKAKAKKTEAKKTTNKSTKKTKNDS